VFQAGSGGNYVCVFILLKLILSGVLVGKAFNLLGFRAYTVGMRHFENSSGVVFV
jgi:hypothetical protein